MLAITIKVLGTVIVMVACVFAALSMLKKFENPESEFANYSEMEASGLIEAGWIPKIIPKSAFEIHETHNVDTNTVRVSFRFSPGDIGITENECRSVPAINKELVFECAEGILTLTEEGHGYFTSEWNEISYSR